MGFVVDGFGIPDGAIGKDDFFYLVFRGFLVAVVVVAKVLTYSYFVICTFYGQLEVYIVAISYHFGDYVIWRDSFAELNSVYAARVHNRVHAISLAKDIGVVAFATSEIVVAGAANESVVASVAFENVVTGVAIYQSIQITHTEQFSIGRTA